MSAKPNESSESTTSQEISAPATGCKQSASGGELADRAWSDRASGRCARRQGALGRGALVRGIWRASATHPRAPLVGEFVRFGRVGVANPLLPLAVYTVLLKVLALYYLVASGICF